MSAIGLGWLYVGWGAVLFETNYGLMQHSPFEIKERLLKALDKEYNVLDMPTVLEIVTLLERTPITKEALETTRLGRDINELRRKTKNEKLAKRAKDLVRRWRDMILPTSAPPPAESATAATTVPMTTPIQQQQTTVATTTEVSQQNGSNGGTAASRLSQAAKSSSSSVLSRTHLSIPATSPAVSLPNSDKSCASSPVRVEAVPKTHAANKRLRKDITSSSTSPSLVENRKTLITGTNNDSSSSPELPSAKRAKTESQPPKTTITPSSERLNGDHYDSVGSDCEIVSVTLAAQPSSKQQKTRKKAPKDRTTKKKKGNDDIVKEKIASIARIPKVKTTQELLASLKSRGNDTVSNSVPTVEHDVLARNKTEHIARFLRSQQQSTEDVEIIDVESQDALETKSTESQSLPEPAGAGAAGEPEVVVPQERTPEEILSRLPPLDLDSIRWDETPLPSPQQDVEVTQEDLDRLLSQQVEGLNGNFEESAATGESQQSPVFREWHQLVTRTSYNGDKLHILPYVVID